MTVENPTSNARRIYVVIAFLAIAVASMVGYSFYTGNRVTEQFTPLTRDMVSVQRELALSHLWFEEHLSGDPVRDTSDVFGHLRAADSLVAAIVGGHGTSTDEIIPLGDKAFRHLLDTLHRSIHELERLTHERLTTAAEAGVGSDKDEQFDKVFMQCLSHASATENHLHNRIDGEVRAFRITQMLLLSASIFLGLLVAVVVRKQEKGRAAAFAEVERANLQLQEDIRRRQTVESQFQEQATLYRSTIDSLTHPFYLIDAKDFTVKLANKAGEHAVGGECRNTIAIPACDCSGDFKQCPVEIVKSSRKGHVQEFVKRDEEGKDRVFEVRAYPLLSADGEVSSVIIYHNDTTDRRRSQEALRKSEERLRGIISAAPIGIGLVHERIIGWTNQRVTELTGYSAQELNGMHARQLYESDEEFERVGREKHGQIEHGQVGSVETRWVCKDGKVIDIVLSSCSLRERDLSSGLVFTVLDVTARKIAEEERDRLFNFSIDMLCISDSTGNFMQVNPAFTQTLGWSEEELLSRPYMELVHPEDLMPTQDALSDLVTGRNLVAFENRNRRKDGSYCWISWNAFALPAQDRIFAVARDVTHRKAAEEEILRSERRFRSIIESSPMGMHLYRIGSGGKLVFEGANPAATEILGIGHDQFIGLPIEEAFPALAETEVPMRYYKAAIEGESWETEQITYDEGGISGAFHVVAFQTVPGHMVCLFQDISHRKRVEAEREALVSDLEAKNTELERFTYTVSHDLKSPLITIRGFLGMVERDIQETAAADTLNHIVRISNAAQKMQQLLDELLTLSRVGKMIYASKPVDLYKVACEDRDLVAGQLSELNIEIKVAEDLPVVSGDRPRLVQILQNLFDNAIKYIGEQESPRIEMGWRNEDPAPVFFVKDNGIGIESRYHEKIFGLFDKLDPASRGTGVGLALVRRIIELHRGRIWVESEGEGKGTSFCFTLRAEDATEDETSTEEAEQAAGKS